jgi:hypothetical protein
LATVNIGNLTFTHKGDYASGTQYVKNDVVYYSTNGNAYIAKQTTTGNAPTNATYWSQFAQGSGGIWNAGLSLGTAGQVVKVNSGATALEFGAMDSGKTLGVTQFTNGTRASMSAGGSSGIDFWSVNYTQLKANSKLLIYVGLHCYNGSAGAMNYRIYYDGVAHTDIPIYNYYPSHAQSFHGMKLIDGASSTGSKVLKINYYAQTGTHYPSQIFNPNSADDGRYVQQNSIMIVQELDF